MNLLGLVDPEIMRLIDIATTYRMDGQLKSTKKFANWYKALVKAASTSSKAEARLVRVRALLLVLRRIAREPASESSELCLVAEAKRHQLWRLAHGYDADVQVRLIIWWEADGVAWVLYGGDKAGVEDTWYTTAASRAEVAIDEILRKRRLESGGRADAE